MNPRKGTDSSQTHRWRRQSRANPSLKTRLFQRASQNQISVAFGCYQQRKAPFRLEFAGNRTAFPGGRPHYSILFPSIRARAREASDGKTRYCGPRRKLGSDIRCVLDDTGIVKRCFSARTFGITSSPWAAGPSIALNPDYDRLFRGDKCWSGG
jgi:hypothetical protein